jgi:hypothetical protein
LRSTALIRVLLFPFLQSQVAGETLCFLYMMLLVTLGLSMIGQAGNTWSRHGLPTLDVLVTVLYFTAITIEMQVILAIVLSSEPPPSRLPPPLDEWVMATAVWLFLVNYFLGYAMTLHAPEPTYFDLTLAGIASAVNLAITVYSMLHVSSCVVRFVSSS